MSRTLAILLYRVKGQKGRICFLQPWPHALCTLAPGLRLFRTPTVCVSLLLPSWGVWAPLGFSSAPLRLGCPSGNLTGLGVCCVGLMFRRLPVSVQGSVRA